MKAFHALILVAAMLSACGEKPQTIGQISSEQAAQEDLAQKAMRERTTRQGESERIY